MPYPSTTHSRPLTTSLLRPAIGLAVGLALAQSGCDNGPLEPSPGVLGAQLSPDPDCPADLPCEYIPAAHQITDPMTGSYGNYDLADRPLDGIDIRYIVIHDTDETYEKTLQIFKDPNNKAAAHYVVRSSDGHVVKMIAPKHVAWHAGNWYYNTHSVGIEHIGYAFEGYKWYSEEMYQASAKLVRHLAWRYNIPLDRAHIFGHDEVPGGTMARQKSMHWDPGPYWDWDHYMQLVRSGSGELSDDGNPGVIAIRPRFAENRPAMTYCYSPDETTDCRATPPEPANFLYLHQAPSEDSPLVTNTYLSWPGDRSFNWGNKAVTGRLYYRTERHDDWDAIFYNGGKAWFHNPGGTSTRLSSARVITPKAGLGSVPIFGFGYPEAAAYLPPTLPQTIEKIYDLPAGQNYVATQLMTADYYWAKEYKDTVDPTQYVVVKDKTEYYQINWNHRSALVRASDVDEVPMP